MPAISPNVKSWSSWFSSICLSRWRGAVILHHLCASFARDIKTTKISFLPPPPPPEAYSIWVFSGLGFRVRARAVYTFRLRAWGLWLLAIVSIVLVL